MLARSSIDQHTPTTTPTFIKLIRSNLGSPLTREKMRTILHVVLLNKKRLVCFGGQHSLVFVVLSLYR